MKLVDENVADILVKLIQYLIAFFQYNISRGGMTGRLR